MLGGVVRTINDTKRGCGGELVISKNYIDSKFLFDQTHIEKMFNLQHA